MYLYFLFIFCNAKCKEMIELWKRVEMEEERQAGPSTVPRPLRFIRESVNSRTVYNIHQDCLEELLGLVYIVACILNR